MPSLTLPAAQPVAQAVRTATPAGGRAAAPRAPAPLRIVRSSIPSRLSSPLRAVRADAPTEVVDATILNTISSVTAAADAALASAAAASKAAAAAAAAAPAPTSELKQRVLAAVETVQAGLLERETEVRGVWCSSSSSRE